MQLATAQKPLSREQMRAIANVHAVLYDEHGNIKDERHGRNLVVDTGLALIADQMSASPGSNGLSHMAIGTDDTAVTASDTALGNELDRNALTSLTDSGAVLTAVGTWSAGDGTGAITEYGLFNAASTGTLFARHVADVINKGASDTLVVTWTVTFAAA